MNKNYEAFRNGIMYLMRSSGLEIGGIFYVLKDILREVEGVYSNTINQEIEEEERQRREAEEKQKAEETNKADASEDASVEAGNGTEL